MPPVTTPGPGVLSRPEHCIMRPVAARTRGANQARTLCHVANTGHVTARTRGANQARTLCHVAMVTARTRGANQARTLYHVASYHPDQGCKPGQNFVSCGELPLTIVLRCFLNKIIFMEEHPHSAAIRRKIKELIVTAIPFPDFTR